MFYCNKRHKSVFGIIYLVKEIDGLGPGQTRIIKEARSIHVRLPAMKTCLLA